MNRTPRWLCLLTVVALAAFSCAAPKPAPQPATHAATPEQHSDGPCVCGSRGPCRGYVLLRYDLSAEGVVKNPAPVKSCGDRQLEAAVTRDFAAHNFGPRESAQQNLEVLLVFRPDATPAPESESR